MSRKPYYCDRAHQKRYLGRREDLVSKPYKVLGYTTYNHSNSVGELGMAQNLSFSHLWSDCRLHW